MTEFRFTDRHVRAAAKAARDGVESLTPEERELYDELAEMGKQWAEDFTRRTTPEQRQRMAEGFEAFQRMSWADRLRYGDWTPLDLWAFLPLIEDKEGPTP